MKSNKFKMHGLKKTFTSLALVTALLVGNLGLGGGFADSAKTVKAAEAAKVDSASAVNYSSVLGRGVDYGIVSDSFKKVIHMETTLATKLYNGGDNTDIDLTDAGTAQLLVAELDGNSKLVLGRTSNLTKQINVEAPQEVLDSIVTEEGFNAKLVKKATSKEIVSASVDDMLKHAADESAKMAEKANSSEYKVDINEVGYAANPHFYLDLSDDKYENAVVYVNASDNQDLLNALANTQQLHIVKNSSTVVVMNVDTEGYQRIGKYDVTVVDGSNVPIDTTTDSGSVTDHNKQVDKEIAQKIIWNLPNASNVEINISAGLFLVPKGNVDTTGSSAGWVVAGGQFTNSTAEWHYIYNGYSETSNSDALGHLHFAARKAFANTYNGRNTEENTTVFIKPNEYTFSIYETKADFSTNGVAPVNASVPNSATGKVKFPEVVFYTNANEASGDAAHTITKGQSKTFYYVIKENNAGQLSDVGIRNSNGEIDITLVVTNKDDILSYKASSVTYLTSNKNDANIYTSKNNIDVYGVEFQLGEFFNLVEQYDVEISKANQFGNEVPGATLEFKGTLSLNGDPVLFTRSMLELGNGATENNDWSRSRRDYLTGKTVRNSNYVVTWKSGTSPTFIHNLPDGTYTLTETGVPNGYDKAETITFTIEDGVISSVVNGTLVNNKITMLDKYIANTVEINKADQFGEEVFGATLNLSGNAISKDNTGRYQKGANLKLNINDLNLGAGAKLLNDPNTAEVNDLRWQSGTASSYIKNIADGIYTLREDNYPDGYDRAEEITFIVEKGKITHIYTKFGQDGQEELKLDGQKVTMIDKANVVISKVALGMGDELAGATLTLKARTKTNAKLDLNNAFATYDGNGIRIVNDGTKTTTNTATGELEWISGGYEWSKEAKPAQFKNLPDGVYTLTEAAAPEGYEKFSNTVEFEIENGIVVSLKANGENVTNEKNKIILSDSPIKTSTDSTTESTTSTTKETTVSTTVITDKTTVTTTKDDTTESSTEGPKETSTDKTTVTTTDKQTESTTEKKTETTTEKTTETTTEKKTETTTEEPTEPSSEEQTDAPTDEPTEPSSEEQTDAPTDEPTEPSSEEQTDAPTDEPTEPSSEEQTDAPTDESTEPSSEEEPSPQQSSEEPTSEEEPTPEDSTSTESTTESTSSTESTTVSTESTTESTTASVSTEQTTVSTTETTTNKGDVSDDGGDRHPSSTETTSESTTADAVSESATNDVTETGSESTTSSIETGSQTTTSGSIGDEDSGERTTSGVNDSGGSHNSGIDSNTETTTETSTETTTESAPRRPSSSGSSSHKASVSNNSGEPEDNNTDTDDGSKNSNVNSSDENGNGNGDSSNAASSIPEDNNNRNEDVNNSYVPTPSTKPSINVDVITSGEGINIVATDNANKTDAPKQNTDAASKLPQSGSPIDTSLLLGLGVILMLTGFGIFAKTKKNKA